MTKSAEIAAPPARVLAEFAARLTVDAIPESARERTKDLLLDAIASALGGVEDAGTPVFTRLATELMGPGASTVIGGGVLSAAGATLVNAHLVSSVSLCDVHYPTWCHLTPEVVPPALTVAEQRKSSGAGLLVAVAAGCELTARVGLGLNYPALHARGWNTSGVAGVFGAATAAGLLMGLDGVRLTHALGMAGAQAAGSDAHRGTQTVRFLQPRAALSGLMSAQLAGDGFTAMEDVLASPFGGIYHTHSDGGTPEAAVAALGERWEMQEVWLTQWPLALLVRNIVNTWLELVLREDLRVAGVQRVRVLLSPRADELYGRMPFDVPSRARTSPAYLVSAVLRDRALESAQFTAARIADPATGEFARTKVEVLADPALAERAVRIEAHLTDGRVVSHFRAVAHGDASDPLTRAEIVEKLRREAAPVLSDANTRRVVDFVESIERQGSVVPLLDALRR